MESRVEFEIEQQSPQQQHYDDGDIIIPESEDYNHFSGNSRRHSLSLPDFKQAGTLRRISSDLAVSVSPEEAPSKNKDVSSTVESLLSCFSDLDYLDRINGDQVILEDMFRSKYVLVFAVEVPRVYDFCDVFPKDLVGVCSELYRFRDDFEMVVAITGNDSDLGEAGFNYLRLCLTHFSLVVPYEHLKIRASLCDYLGVNARGSSNCLLVNANQNILHYNSTAAEQYLQDLFPVSPIDIVTFFNRLIRSTWPVVSSEAKGPALLEGTCPVSNSMIYVLPEYPHDINKMVSESQKSCPIEIGQSFDVISLLSGGGVLSYLDRKDGDPVAVKEETFIGKYIMICCFHVPIFRDSSDADAYTAQHIVNTCFDLYTRNDFEMVVVVKMRYKADYEAVFDHFLSVFPSCLVVPYKESMHRDFICKYLDLVANSSIKCLILDADDNRNILYHGTPDFLYSYGADAFPFTEEKVKEVLYKDETSHSSLEGLLECNSSYVLENGNEETITISELNKKVVALYLCVDGKFTSTLHMVHQQCIENQLSFEIVLVYMPFHNCLDPRVHKGKIDRLLKKKRISWWCLPINNNVSLKFKRLVGCRDDFKLIIVGPDNEYVDLRGGEEILQRHGINGYPFTREGFVQKELKRLHGLTLESLLVIGSKNYVYKGSITYPLADLQGKNVLVYFVSAERSKDLYHQLLTWYPEIKADVDDLEVVIVRLEDGLVAAYDDLEVAESVKPWYVCPYDPEHSKILREKIFIIGRNRACETLVKFGSDGKICSFRAQHYLTYDGPKAFREIGDPHLRQDVIREYLGSCYN